jgi:hypothetical protein
LHFLLLPLLLFTRIHFLEKSLISLKKQNHMEWEKNRRGSAKGEIRYFNFGSLFFHLSIYIKKTCQKIYFCPSLISWETLLS